MWWKCVLVSCKRFLNMAQVSLKWNASHYWRYMPYIICIAIMSGCSSGTDFLVSEILPSMSTSIQHQLSVLMSSSCQFYNHGNQYTCQDQKYQKLGYHSRISHTWTPVFWIFSCFVVGFFTLPERHIYSPQELRLLGSTPLKKIKAHLPNPSCTDVGGFFAHKFGTPYKSLFYVALDLKHRLSWEISQWALPLQPVIWIHFNANSYASK